MLRYIISLFTAPLEADRAQGVQDLAGWRNAARGRGPESTQRSGTAGGI